MLTKRMLATTLLVTSVLLGVIPAETKTQGTKLALAQASRQLFKSGEATPALPEAALGAEPVAPFPDAPKQIDMKYLERVNKTAEPLSTINFTVDEFLKAPSVSNGPNGKPQITIRKFKRIKNVDSVEAVTVPLDQYVAELNQHEKFLNQHGATLRDGKLNKQNPNDTQIQENLGVLFRLRDRKQADQDWKPKVDLIWTDPNFLALYQPHDPGLRLDEWIVSVNNPRELSARLREFNARDAARLGAARRNLTALYYRTAVDQLGGRILTFHKEGGKAECEKKAPSWSVGLDPLCDEGGPPPCKAKPAQGPSEKFSIETQQEICGEGAKQAEDPACLFEGVITPKTFAAMTMTFDSSGGGNNWFGAYAAIDLLAHLKQDGTPYVEISNVGKARAGLLILGGQIELFNASNYTNYNTKMQPAVPDVKRTAMALPGLKGHDLIANPFNASVSGPGTVVFIPPIPPIVISSEFKASISMAGDKEPFQAVPTTCQGGSGKVRMFLGPRAAASVEITAKLEALVASAGIKGVLTLADDTFGAALTTDVLPASNRVDITPSLEFNYNHLSGAIILFLKLDMGFYTKEWSVELINVAGFHGSKTMSPKTYTFSSKRNEICVCE